jgi:hypothetical protein
MLRLIPALAACCALASCGLPTMLQGQQITYTGMAGRPIQEAADCAYLAISKDNSGSVRKTDILSQGMVYVELVADGVRFWRYTFKSEGKTATKVELESFKPPITDGIAGSFDKGMIAPLRSCGFS